MCKHPISASVMRFKLVFINSYGKTISLKYPLRKLSAAVQSKSGLQAAPEISSKREFKRAEGTFPGQRGVQT